MNKGYFYTWARKEIDPQKAQVIADKCASSEEEQAGEDTSAERPGNQQRAARKD